MGYLITLDTAKGNLDGSENLLDMLLSEMVAYIVVKNTLGKYVYVNERARRLFNRDLESIIGFDDYQFFDSNAAKQISKSDRDVLIHGETVTDEERNIEPSSGEVKIYRCVKKPIHNRDGQIIGLIGISTDITEICYLREEIKLRAATDSMTGLYNRRYFIEVGERYVSEGKRHKKPLSLMLVDIDYLNRINQSYGYSAGDKVISLVGSTIAQLLRKEDVLARVAVMSLVYSSLISMQVQRIA